MGYEESSSLGNNLFICTNFSDGCEGDITIGNPQTCTITNGTVFCEVTVDTITGVGVAPVSVAYDPVNERMYVTDSVGSSVYVINTTTNTVIDTNPNLPGINPIPVGVNPIAIAYDPINQDMYVVNFGNNNIIGTVSVIDTTTNTVIDTNPNLPGINPIPVSLEPYNIAYDPVNERMYVTNDSGFVFVIDTTTNTVIDTNPNLPGINPIPVGFTTFGIAYGPINQDMYVTDIDGPSVYVIDTTTNTVIDTNPNLPGINPIPVGFQPRH